MTQSQTRKTIGTLVLVAVVTMSFSALVFAAKEAAPAVKPAVAVAPASRVDLNKADLAELETIKGVGPALAERIMTYRNENGKFKTIQDITNVKGIGQSKFERIKDQLIVS